MVSPMRIEPTYVVDTQALVMYLTDPDKLGQGARTIFQAARQGQTRLIVPAIVLAELFYANGKWKWFEDFEAVYDHLKHQPQFAFVPLMPDDVLDFRRDSTVPEMHDRIIAGLARRLDVPLITADPKIVNAGLVAIAW